MGQMFSYNGNSVTMKVQNGVVYVNLTEVAKAFPSKNLTQIVNSQEIKEYCECLSKLQNYSLADLLIVTRGGNSNGTWAHQKVALRVAQKLSPDFAVWVDTKIEELLTTGVTTTRDDDEAIAYAMGVLQKRLEESKARVQLLEANNEMQAEELKEAAPKVEYHDKVLTSESTYTTTQVAKEFGMGAITLNRILHEKGVQYKQNDQWLLYSRYQDKGYTKTITRMIEKGSDVFT